MITITSAAQTADNGLTANSGNIQLGGTLNRTTSIDQNNFGLHLWSGNNQIFTTLPNGNVGLGTTTPWARLSFLDVHLTEEPIGIGWYNGGYGGDATRYGIHRTAGPWVGPDYAQLRLGWLTGIVLDPGVSHGKSYVDVVGNGIRVTQGSVGIGTTTTHSKFEINSDNGDDQSHYIPTTWDTYSTRFNGGNVSIFSTGNAGAYGDSYQLSFYARYGNAGQGIQTNKAAYIKGSVANDAILPPQACGRGTLVLGSVNTDYNNNTFNDVPAMYVTNAKVGIGVNNPESQLHTTGTVRFAGLTNDNAKDRVVVSDANGNLAYRDASTLGGSATAGWSLTGNNDANAKLGTIGSNDLPIITGNVEQMRIGANGNVGIGTTAITGNYKLSVEGTIRTRKVRVDAGTWADYVFESDYKLRPLKEVEQYIQQEKHLPEVPSAAEVKKEGLDVGDNQALLLKKIEELTLYVIQQQKQLEAQQQKIETLEKKVNEKK